MRRRDAWPRDVRQPLGLRGKENVEDTPLAEKLAALVELAHGFEKISPPKHFAILKKHIKAFVTGFDGAAELRARLMQAENAHELASAIRLHEQSAIINVWRISLFIERIDPRPSRRWWGRSK